MAAPDHGEVIIELAQYGVFGLAAAGLMFGKLVPRWAAEKESEVRSRPTYAYVPSRTDGEFRLERFEPPVRPSPRASRPAPRFHRLRYHLYSDRQWDRYLAKIAGR